MEVKTSTVIFIPDTVSRALIGPDHIRIRHRQLGRSAQPTGSSTLHPGMGWQAMGEPKEKDYDP